MTPERWVPVRGFEGLYEVSDAGHVRSLGRLRPHSSGKAMERRPALVLKPSPCAGGYLFVTLSAQDGTRRMAKVHRLVAAAFVANPSGKPDVNHLDFNRTNNQAVNLEWVTRAENTAHSIRAGRWKNMNANGTRLATNNPLRRKKLTPPDVSAIRAACAAGDFQYVVAERFGITQGVVSKIVRGVLWAPSQRREPQVA